MRKFFKKANWLMILYFGVLLSIVFAIGNKILSLDYTYQVYLPTIITFGVFVVAAIGSIIEKIAEKINDFTFSTLNMILEEVKDENE